MRGVWKCWKLWSWTWGVGPLLGKKGGTLLGQAGRGPEYEPAEEAGVLMRELIQGDESDGCLGQGGVAPEDIPQARVAAEVLVLGGVAVGGPPQNGVAVEGLTPGVVAVGFFVQGGVVVQEGGG